MTKAIRNLIIGAAMTAGVFAASTAAMAATQFVQSDMNFRNGPAVTSEIIGSVPAGSDPGDSCHGQTGRKEYSYHCIDGQCF